MAAVGRVAVAAGILFLVPGGPPGLVAQEAPREEDSDALFARARSLPKERREEARELLRKGLKRSPDYHDLRIHLARLHAWDGQYEAARESLAYVLERAPRNLEAREVLIDVENWADRPHEALRVCQEGLALDPKSAQLHYRKARILKGLGDFEGGLSAVNAALLLDANHQPARLLRDDLKELTQRWKVSLDYTYDTFDKTFDPWKAASLSLGHRFGWGSMIARVNRAERYGDTGGQFELDAYPRIVEGTYAYLNAGFSSASLYPEFRAGGELYHNFSRGIEASLGFRYMDFSGSSVTIYTGSLGKYYGDYLFTLRANVTPSSIGSSLSGSFSVRYYLGDSDSYLSALVGSGVSPDQRQGYAEIVQLSSARVGVGAQKRFRHSIIAWVNLGVERQEYLKDEFRQQRSLTLGIEKRF